MDISDEEEMQTQRQEENEIGENNTAPMVQSTIAPIDFGSDSDMEENTGDDKNERKKSKKNESEGKGAMSVSQRLRENWDSDDESENEVENEEKKELKKRKAMKISEINRKRKVEKRSGVEDSVSYENNNSRRKVRYEGNDELTQLDIRDAEEHKSEYIRNGAEEHKSEYIRNGAEEHKDQYIRNGAEEHKDQYIQSQKNTTKYQTKRGKLLGKSGRNTSALENQDDDTDDEIFNDSASPHGIKGPGSARRNDEDSNDDNNGAGNDSDSRIVSKMPSNNRSRMINDSDED